SKPPMIAWLIGATTSIFGHEEWAVRLSSPLIHPLTTYILFRTGRYLFDERTGFWAALLYFLMPAVWLSSAIVSTDVALLFFWTLALNAWAHLRDEPTFKWAVLLGIAIGFGMLSKYAMIFFIIGLVMCALFDKKTRSALVSKNGIMVIAIALLILSPNLYWNMTHNFSTLTHTAENAGLGGSFFHPKELIEFWLGQLGMLGPITLVIMLSATIFILVKKPSQTELSLAIFTLCPLIIISVEAILSHANANWAVSAYMAGTLLTARIAVSHWPRALKFGVGLNIVLGSVLAVISLSPQLTNTLGAANSVKRVRGWPQTEAMLVQIAKKGHDGHKFIAVATDNRLAFYDLLYYGIEQDTGLPLRMWMNTSQVLHHAEANAPLRGSHAEAGPVLIINHHQDCHTLTGEKKVSCLRILATSGALSYADKFRDDFIRLEELPPFKLDLGGGKTRTFRLWAGYGYTPTEMSRR
ncbi:MAG: glycosyltransferase family 39 protein, partial [Robiginitomaculum sp.]|nr:glycosyltransferase family 39 protein [Robiginitomaculum sp.]